MQCGILFKGYYVVPRSFSAVGWWGPRVYTNLLHQALHLETYLFITLNYKEPMVIHSSWDYDLHPYRVRLRMLIKSIANGTKIVIMGEDGLYVLLLHGQW